jgi:flagellar hook protein FlgE
MLVASYGLQNTSNNVANMQSSGFKRNDVFYSSLGNGNGEEGLGSGVHIGGNAINFSEGKLLSSSNPSDLAITGQGFFIVKTKAGELLYTRDGEFSFDKGVLIDRHSGGEVQGYDRAGNLVPIYEKGPKTSTGKATREIFLNGKFITHEKSENDPTIPNFGNYDEVSITVENIYDAQGKAHTITLEFRIPTASVERDEDKVWELKDIIYDDPNTHIDIPSFQKIKFSGNDQGAKREDSNLIQMTLGGKQPVNIHFGTNDDGDDLSVQLHRVTAYDSTDSKISVCNNDGYGEGKQFSFSFDENGQISYNYDNGQSITGLHVGLARFDDMEHTLTQTNDNLFRAQTDKRTHLGRANKDGFGSIKPKNLESSNVDSTTEFANIVILQRMFQACSQIMDIDKQLLEGLESR